MTIRIRPFAFWKAEAHESWFMHMAKKGYALKKMGLFAHFTKIPSQPIRYRIDISTDKKAPQDKIELFEECGWNYVTSYNYFHVFSANDSSVPELHTDLEEQANGFLALQKKWKPTIILNFIFFILLLLLMAFTYVSNETPYTTFLRFQSSNIMLVFFYLYLMGYYYKGYRYFKRKYRELKSGVSWNRNNSFKKEFFWDNLFHSFFLLFLVFNLVITSMSIQSSSNGNWEEFEDKNKFYQLENIRDSLYSSGWSVISPIQLSLYQLGEEESLLIKVNKINVPFILSGYVKEKIEWLRKMEYKVTTLTHVYFEQLYKIGNGGYYIAIKDNIYYELSYSGTELSQKQLIDEMVTSIQLIQSK